MTSEQIEQKSKLADLLQRQSQWSNWTVVAMLVLCFFVLIQFGPLSARSGAEHRGVGQTLPRLRLQPLTGSAKPVDLKDLTGRVVLLNFFGTSSPASSEQLPHLADIRRKFSDRPAFRFLAVSCGRSMRENVPALRQSTTDLLQELGISLPTHVDPGGYTRLALDQAAGFDGLPTTVLIDRLGRIQAAWIGFEPGMEVQIEQFTTQLLDE